jgi:hypothetical protein
MFFEKLNTGETLLMHILAGVGPYISGYLVLLRRHVTPLRETRDRDELWTGTFGCLRMAGNLAYLH